jgi:hypothetical protein
MGKYLRQYLTGSEWKLWSYLATLDPFGDKYLELPNTLTVLIECNISKRSFYRAIAKFQELELFDFQDKGFHFRNVSVPKEDNSHDMDWRKCATIGTNDATVGTNNATIGTTSIYQELQTDQTSLETRTREKKDEANSLDLELANENTLELEKENELENTLDLDIEGKLDLENSLDLDLEGKLELEKENELENSLDLESATTKPTLSEIPKTEIQSLAKSESGSVEKFSAVVSAPEKPKPKPRPRIKAWESWPPAGPWNINGQLDMNFRDAIAQSWVVAYGGDVHKKKADVLCHFKKDPDNLAIAWEQYQSEYLNRYETTQILMTNGVEIPQEYQRRLINNQRAITQSLPQEINLITAPAIPDSVGSMRSLAGVVKPLALTEAIQTAQTTQTAERTTIKTEDGKTYQTYQKPVLENPATPEQMGEMLERIKAFTQGGRMGQRKPVVELTEEAIALEKEAKKTNYLANLNEMLKDPILRKEAMKEAFKREDLEFLFDEDGSPYQVTYAEC